MPCHLFYKKYIYEYKMYYICAVKRSKSMTQNDSNMRPMKKLWNLILGNAPQRANALHRAEEEARKLNPTRRIVVDRPKTGLR